MGLFSRNKDRDKDPDGVPGRAVIVYVGGVGGRAAGEEPPHKDLSRNIKLDVRLIAGDGTIQAVKGRLPGFVWWLLEEGQEIAVRVDPASGAVIGYDRAALETEFTPRIGELRAGRRPESLFDLEKGELANLPAAVKDLRKDLRNLPHQLKDAMADRPPSGGGLAGDDPLLAPIEGVDFDTWVTVQAAVVRERVAPRDHDALAQRHGVPVGRWPAVQSGWQARMKGNPGLAQRFGEVYQVAVRRD